MLEGELRATATAPPPTSLRRSIVVTLAGIATAIACLEAGGGVWEHVGSPDLHALFLPKYEAAARALLVEHRLPLWNPNEDCGLPLLGTAQGAVLYPPVVLLFGFLSPRTALQAFYALHVAILGIGVLLYLRRHDVPSWAAAIVPVVAIAGLASGIRHAGYDHPSFLASVAWMPLMLLVVEVGTQRGLRLSTGLLALLMGAQWLAGYPDFPLDTAVLLAVVMLVGGRRWTRGVVLLATGIALGTVLAAIQLLPLAEVLPQSPRNIDPDLLLVGRDRFAIASVDDLVRALTSGHGVATLVMSVIGIVTGGRIALGWAAALVWALFALNSPFVWLYSLPPYAGIRFPFGWSGIASLLIACLAARGLATIASCGRLARAAAWVLAVVVVVEAGAILVAVPAALSLGSRAPDPELVATRAATITALLAPARGLERVLSPADVLRGVPLRFGIPSPMGYEPSLPPYRIVRLLQAAGLGGVGPQRDQEWGRVARNAGLLAVLGVGTVIAPKSAAPVMARAGFRPVGDVPPDDVALWAPAVPRVRLLHRVEVVDDEDASFARLVANPREAARTVVLERGAVPPVADPAIGAPEHAAIVVDAAELLLVDVEAAAPALLVVADTYYPGWTATVDGVPAPVLRADYAFRAVAVGAGAHRIELHYHPASVRIGMIVSAVALALVLAIVAPRRHRASG